MALMALGLDHCICLQKGNRIANSEYLAMLVYQGVFNYSGRTRRTGTIRLGANQGVSTAHCAQLDFTIYESNLGKSLHSSSITRAAAFNALCRICTQFVTTYPPSTNTPNCLFPRTGTTARRPAWIPSRLGRRRFLIFRILSWSLLNDPTND